MPALSGGGQAGVDLAARLESARSRVHGLESALAERAVVLLDRLSRSVIHPYAMSSSQTNLAASDFTDFDDDDLRNSNDGPMLVSRLRMWARSEVAATAVEAPLPQYSWMLTDGEGRHEFMRTPVFSSVLFAIDTTTWCLDRPYVLDRGAALLARAREDAGSSVNDVHLSVLGEVVLGGMTGAEVEEALMLGVYPAAGRQSSVWDRSLLAHALFGDRPPRLKGQASDLLADLRDRVAGLRMRLMDAVPSAWSLESGTLNLAASATTAMSREDMRNDEGGPFLVSEMRMWTASALAAASAGAVFSNVDVSVESVAERIRLMSDPVMAGVLVSRETGTWRFDHPHIVSPTGSLQVHLRETAANATTDVNVSFLGEVLRGVSQEDVRSAVALGLLPTSMRGFE